MKQLFPILISVYTISIVLFIILKNKQKPWSELSEKEKRLWYLSIIIGVVFLLAGIVMFLIYNN